MSKPDPGDVALAKSLIYETTRANRERTPRGVFKRKRASETMKVVINAKYGGLGLSPLAVKRLAELQGRECYFFNMNIPPTKYTPITAEEASRITLWHAFDIPNPDEFLLRGEEEWSSLSLKERQKRKTLYEAHSIYSAHNICRHDPLLIQVVEELGEKASRRYAKLKIVEIPDGVNYEIEDDGRESIHEVHRSWS